MIRGLGRKPGECGVLEAKGKRVSGRRKSASVSDGPDSSCNIMTEEQFT